MIKEQINIMCGDAVYENCTLIVPSQILTSTPQEETLDLEKSPNFQIVVPTYINKGTYEVMFSVGGNDCTANMIVVNNGSVNCTLQYVDGMTIEEGDSSDDSSDEPTEDTFAFELNRYECSAVYNGTTTEYTDATVVFLVNDVPTSLSPSEVSISGIGNTLAQYTALDGGAYGFRCTAESKISTTVSVTATYNGMTSTTTLIVHRSENIPAGPSFTWDGSDQNNPLQVNVNLSAFDSADVRIYPNLSAPEGIQYPWGSDTTWTPEISLAWYSNTNDFPIMGFFEGGGDFSPVDDYDNNMNQTWKDGPTTAGTYLKSYTCTFVYNKDYSEKYDETTNEQLDDPIAQALDGTVVTFWVEYTVTGAYPEPENP